MTKMEKCFIFLTSSSVSDNAATELEFVRQAKKRICAARVTAHSIPDLSLATWLVKIYYERTAEEQQQPV